MLKKIFTLGCKVNQVESEELEKQFAQYNTDEYILINTCTVTSKSDSKSRQLINKLIRNHPSKKIIITGCYVERAKDELSKIFPNAILITNKDKFNIPKILALTKNKNINKISQSKTRAFLKIQDGCDEFCSYCIIPHVRSNMWSKPIDEINKNIKQLLTDGYKEIVLTGIRTGKYFSKQKNWNFTNLLEHISTSFDIPRIRISSLEPYDISDELITFIKKNIYTNSSTKGNICPFLHIALQSCSDDILKDMYRHYDTKYIKNLFSTLKKEIPSLTITSDIIVGFPTEDEKHFQDTLHFLEHEIDIDGLHIFPFSPRPNTPASNIKSCSSPAKIKSRIEKLQILDKKLRLKNAKKYLGTTQEILIEEKKEYKMYGLTGNYLKVELDYKKDMQNKFVDIKIIDVSNDSQTLLKGKIK